MKRTLLLLTASLLIILMAAFCSIPASAADNVIFVKDGGTGDGSSADKALLATTGNYDASSTNPEKQKDTALYQAIQKLMDAGGGTIVICGPVVLNAETGQGTNPGTKDFMVYALANYKPDVTITYTSVYGGVDYRETADAKLVFDTTVHFVNPTASIWEEITIAVFDGTRTFNCGANKTLLGKGFTSVPMDESRIDDPTAYLTICAGERYRKIEKSTDLTIDIGEGKIGSVFAGNSGAGASFPITGNTNLVINSGIILGNIGGTCRTTSTPVNGSSSITINGGTFKGSIDACGAGGFANTDATAKLIINGGDFSDCMGINDYGVGFNDNPPSYALLDYSKCNDTTAAQIYNLIVGFDEVVAPAGMTTPVETTTAAPETTTAAPVTTTDSKDTTDKPTTTKAGETTKASDTTKASSATEDGDNNTTTIIIIVIAAVVVAAIIVAVVVMSKKKGKKD